MILLRTWQGLPASLAALAVPALALLAGTPRLAAAVVARLRNPSPAAFKVTPRLPGSTSLRWLPNQDLALEADLMEGGQGYDLYRLEAPCVARDWIALRLAVRAGEGGWKVKLSVDQNGQGLKEVEADYSPEAVPVWNVQDLVEGLGDPDESSPMDEREDQAPSALSRSGLPGSPSGSGSGAAGLDRGSVVGTVSPGRTPGWDDDPTAGNPQPTPHHCKQCWKTFDGTHYQVKPKNTKYLVAGQGGPRRFRVRCPGCGGFAAKVGSGNGEPAPASRLPGQSTPLERPGPGPVRCQDPSCRWEHVSDLDATRIEQDGVIAARCGHCRQWVAFRPGHQDQLLACPYCRTTLCPRHPPRHPLRHPLRKPAMPVQGAGRVGRAATSRREATISRPARPRRQRAGPGRGDRPGSSVQPTTLHGHSVAGGAGAGPRSLATDAVLPSRSVEQRRAEFRARADSALRATLTARPPDVPVPVPSTGALVLSLLDRLQLQLLQLRSEIQAQQALGLLSAFLAGSGGGFQGGTSILTPGTGPLSGPRAVPEPASAMDVGPDP